MGSFDRQNTSMNTTLYSQAAIGTMARQLVRYIVRFATTNLILWGQR